MPAALLGTGSHPMIRREVSLQFHYHRKEVKGKNTAHKWICGLGWLCPKPVLFPVFSLCN